MNKEFYRKFFEVQKKHWWFVSKKKIVLDFIDRYVPTNDNHKILDIGCGRGILAFDLARKAGTVVAIDKSNTDIRAAQGNYSARNIEYLLGDAVGYDFGKRFDVVVLSNVLEHVENREGLLKKVKNISPKILIRVPMINRDWITLFKKENGIEWRLDNTHFTEYTLDSFKDELMKADLKLEEYSIQYGEIWGIATAY